MERPVTETNQATELFQFVRELPKAELHLHLEGSLEAQMMLELAERNQIDLAYDSVEEIQAAYDYSCLQDFLDLYYQGMSVLQTPDDFRDLAAAYMKRAAEDGVRHAEVFFDPQAHVSRGLAFEDVADGLIEGLMAGAEETGTSWGLIMCFLRDRSEEEAFEVFTTAWPYFDNGRISGVGLDSAEIGNPPEKFERVFAAARDQGLYLCAHAGEEGPAQSVADTLDLLQVHRIDHGIAAVNDPALVDRLADNGIPLTVCPLSNVRLRCVENMKEHPLKRLYEAGVCVTINSDDPAYFGGYVAENYVAAATALDLRKSDLAALALNSIGAANLDESRRLILLKDLAALASNI